MKYQYLYELCEEKFFLVVLSVHQNKKSAEKAQELWYKENQDSPNLCMIRKVRNPI
jgi:hypothetical protein